eukprot:60890-Pyramimonas_sp.AAC.1
MYSGRCPITTWGGRFQFVTPTGAPSPASHPPFSSHLLHWPHAVDASFKVVPWAHHPGRGRAVHARQIVLDPTVLGASRGDHVLRADDGDVDGARVKGVPKYAVPVGWRRPPGGTPSKANVTECQRLPQRGVGERARLAGETGIPRSSTFSIRGIRKLARVFGHKGVVR